MEELTAQVSWLGLRVGSGSVAGTLPYSSNNLALPSCYNHKYCHDIILVIVAITTTTVNKWHHNQYQQKGGPLKNSSAVPCLVAK